MYNGEVWTTTKGMEREIDYSTYNIDYSTYNIDCSTYKESYLGAYSTSNSELYRNTKETQWSKRVEKRRLSFFGDMARLPDETPARWAVDEFMSKNGRVGRN